MSLADYYGQARENWRIVLLAVFLVVSALALAPGANTEGATTLQYGLELSGGTRVQAPLVGMTAEGVDYSGVDPVEAQRTVAAELNLSETDVQARPGANAFEVYSEDVTREEVAAALGAAGFDVQPGDVRDGVTEQTRRTAREVIETKIQESTEFSGGRVTIVTTPTGEHFLQVEIPNANREEVLALLNERGLVEVRAVYPVQGDNGTTYRNVTMFTQEDLAEVGQVREDREGNPYVPVTLTEEAAENFSAAMREFGYAREGGTRCNWDANRADPGRCLVTFSDGEYVYAAGVAPGLATQFRDQTFGGAFRMNTETDEEARELRIALQAGALPTDIDVEGEGTTFFLRPSLAQEFKLFSLITGVVSALAVAVVVFVRYGESRVAAPMVLTALAEVFILLGFAAAIGLPLDLAHIAGFIAVIGTGVDDLVIIADEVLNRGDVRTRRVFRSRFRKAFWVIGVAAATTIIAMTPLTVLSLGDLSGFAIVTIVGVLIGVLVTRPAYGDILRSLMTGGGD